MSVKTIKFEIVTPERIILKEMIRQVNVSTKDGEITILPDHIPLVATLRPGVLNVVRENGEPDVISVSGGFIEVMKNKIVILADTAERAQEIDLDRAEEGRRRAEELKQKITVQDREQWAGISAQIEKELARVKAAKKWRKFSTGNITPALKEE